MTKALSLWQPWATLIALGAKRYETRNWQTPYRGPMVIHAAKHPLPRDPNNTLGAYFAAALLVGGVKDWDQLPLGYALCAVDLTDVVPTEQIRPFLSREEIAFGDYNRGRFAWKLENLRVFTKPIRWNGGQRLWDWPLPLPEGLAS